MTAGLLEAVRFAVGVQSGDVDTPDVLSLELIRSRGVREGIGDAGKGQDEERDEELHFVVFRWNGGREGLGRRR